MKTYRYFCAKSIDLLLGAQLGVWRVCVYARDTSPTVVNVVTPNNKYTVDK